MTVQTAATTMSQALSTSIDMRCEAGPLSVERARPASLRLGKRFQTRERRDDWLLGRLALGAVIRSLGLVLNPDQVRFPHPKLSLTHAGGLALAVGSLDTVGIGVDYEPRRQTSPEMARWFLTSWEQDRIECLPGSARSRTRLRCWTIKEAAFKACPDNANLLLRELVISNPACTGHGGEVRARSGWRFRYATRPFRKGILSVAIVLEGPA